MNSYFFTNLTKFYFKHLFFSSYLSDQPGKRLMSRPFFLQIKPFKWWYLYYNFQSAFQIYTALLDQRQQIFFAGTMELVKYDYQFFRFTNYTFNERGDSREYTTKIHTLTRRPYLALFGHLQHASGILINASSNLGPVTKNVRKTGNICVSVMTPQQTLTDYLLTAFPSRSAKTEHIMLAFFEAVATSRNTVTQATQHFLLQLQKREPQKRVSIINRV